MDVKIISWGKKKNTVQVVVHVLRQSITRHLKKAVWGEWLDAFGNKYNIKNNE